MAFWTGCDVARIARLMRRSALARDKWDDHSTYLVERTISGACGQCSDVYRDPAEIERRARAAALSTPGPSGTAVVSPGGVLAHPGANDALPNMRNSVGLAATSARVALDTVRQGVRELQLHVAFDEFTERTTLQDMSEPGSVPRALEDDDSIAIRERMGIGGAKPVKADMMKDVLKLEAKAHRYDSANRWLQRLQWDGVPRVDTFLPAYWGAADTPYTRAVGAYWLTALAGRVLAPGCQADMVPVLVGAQGAGKSTGAGALVPNSDYFVALDVAQNDADLCRMFSGKLVVELSELAGLRKKDRETVKALITRRDDEWVPKYVEGSRKHLRRFLFVGSTNEQEFLDDPTGERRWLPFEVGRVDVKAIDRDRDQLWA
ncbi:MAG: hypothetical protein EOO80_02310, partial [Oxalobacteraceae bacterium]